MIISNSDYCCEIPNCNKDYFSKSGNSCFGSHFLMSNIKMIENQALEPRIFEDLERVKGGSTPKPRINKYLTFNHINDLTYISAL